MTSRPGDAQSTTDRARHDRRGLGSRRVRATAVTISVSVHILAIWLYNSGLDVRPDTAAFPLPTDASSEQGVVVIQIVSLDDPEIERPENPEEITDVELPAAAVEAPSVGGAVAILVPPGPTAAERLRPALVDARFWARPPPEFWELPVELREELILSARIVSWYDSVAVARAAEDRLTDWTFTDSKGGRWGVADGRIYLGDIVVPVPLFFAAPVGKRDFNNRRIWEFEEIERQSQRFLIEESWKERTAAIRARRDRERAAARDTIR